MGSEFDRSQDAPGVQVFEIPSQPDAQTTGADLPGLQGIFRRGPTDEAYVVHSWEEFKRWYGSYHEGNLGPIVMRHFFDQRENSKGASQTVVSRVTGTGAVAGSLTFADSAGVSTLKFNASSVGKWCNDADATTERYVFTTAAPVASGVAISEMAIAEGDAFGYIEIGDYCVITDGTNELWVYVKVVNPASTPPTIEFKEVTPTVSIATGSEIKCATAHLASTTSSAAVYHNETQLSVDSGRNFKKGMRVLLEDGTQDKITSVLLTRVTGDTLIFDPIQLTHSADMAPTVTSVDAKFLTDTELIPFAGVTHNISDQVVSFIGGKGTGQTARAVATFTDATGRVELDANLEEDLDVTSEFTIGSAAKYVEVTAGLATTGDGNGVQANAVFQIVVNAYTDGAEAVAIGGQSYTAAVFGGAGTIEADRNALLALINADEAPGQPLDGVTVSTAQGTDSILITSVSWDKAVGDAVTLVVTDAAVNETSFNYTTATSPGTLGAVNPGTTPTEIFCTQLNAFEALGTTCGLESAVYTIGGSDYVATAFDRLTGKVTFAAGLATKITSAISFTIKDWTFTGFVDTCTNNSFISTTLLPANNYGEILLLAGRTLEITAGTGIGYTGTITVFDETTGTVTLDTDWDDIPDGTSIIKITAVTNVPFNLATGVNVVSQEFHILVYDLDEKIDQISYLSMESTSENYIETRLAGSANETVLVEAEDLSSATYTTDPIGAIPAPISRTKFTGGVEGSVPTNDQMIGTTGTTKTGLYLFDEHQVDYVACPGYYDKDFVDRATTYFEARNDIIFITAPPETAVTPLEATNYRNLTLNNKSASQVAMYWPWLYIRDPESENANSRVLVPPEGAFMGMWSRVSEVRDISKAPANEHLNGVVALPYNVTEGSSEAGMLNNASVNVIFYRPEDGKTVVFGARTLDKNPGKRRIISCRRLFNYVKRRLYTINRPFSFEPNTLSKAKQIVMTNEMFFRGLRERGMLDEIEDTVPFTVVSDMTNNTLSALRGGLRNVSVLFEPVVPLERLRFDVGINSENNSVGVGES